MRERKEGDKLKIDDPAAELAAKAPKEKLIVKAPDRRNKGSSRMKKVGENDQKELEKEKVEKYSKWISCKADPINKRRLRAYRQKHHRKKVPDRKVSKNDVPRNRVAKEAGRVAADHEMVGELTTRGGEETKEEMMEREEISKLRKELEMEKARNQNVEELAEEIVELKKSLESEKSRNQDMEEHIKEILELVKNLEREKLKSARLREQVKEIEKFKRNQRKEPPDESFKKKLSSNREGSGEELSSEYKNNEGKRNHTGQGRLQLDLHTDGNNEKRVGKRCNERPEREKGGEENGRITSNQA